MVYEKKANTVDHKLTTIGHGVFVFQNFDIGGSDTVKSLMSGFCKQ